MFAAEATARFYYVEMSAREMCTGVVRGSHAVSDNAVMTLSLTNQCVVVFRVSESDIASASLSRAMLSKPRAIRYRPCK